ncbi:double zinc ribbon domain-containing protein [Phyllobacterium sp. A18/5-2]
MSESRCRTECSSCKATVPAGSRFCIECGAPISVLCA